MWVVGRIENDVGAGARQGPSVRPCAWDGRHRCVTGHRGNVFVHVVLEDVQRLIGAGEAGVSGHCGLMGG